MEDIKRRGDAKRRLSFSIFKNRRSEPAAPANVGLERSASLEETRTATESDLAVRRTRRRSTLDSFATPPVLRLEAVATMKERRLTKRATVCFETMTVSEELANMAAAADKAATTVGGTAIRRQSLGAGAAAKIDPTNNPKVLLRSNSWADLKKLAGAEQARAVMEKIPASSDGIPARHPKEGQQDKYSYLHYSRVEMKPARKREVVVQVGQDLPEQVRKRNQVINEIINTEKDYVYDLRTMVSIFKNPMLEENILTKEEVGVMFSNVHLLIEVNKMLLADMVQRVKDTNGDELGDSFLLLGDYLKMYATYCGNHASAVELVGKCEKANARFRSFLARPNAQTNRLSLRDYLIKPVQRICKYPLLLRELIKCTDESHPDFDKLRSALTKIQSVVASVNERKQQEDGVEAVAKVISQLKNTEKFGVQLMVPGRQYTGEGTLLEASKEHNEFFPRHYFLFSDLLVLTEGSTKVGKSQKGALKQFHEVVEMLPFSEAQVNLKMNGMEDNGNSVEIESADALYVLPFLTAEQKRKWIQSYLLCAERSSPAASPLRRKQSS
jgi:hypothetical protein